MLSKLSSGVLLITLCAATSSSADDWRQFRGAGGLGTDTSTDDFPDKLEDASHVAWKIAVPPGHSSPIVVGNSIVLTGHESGHFVIQCFDRTDGSSKWKREIPVAQLEKVYHHGPATPTPVSDGEYVYCLFGSFGIIALDLDGKELWRKELTIADNMYGTAASPVLVDSHLVLLLSDQKHASLMALDKSTGREVWNRKVDGPASSWSTPAFWPASSPLVALIYEPFHLRGISLKSGEELWSVPGLADEPISVPQVVGNQVIVTSYNMRTNQEVIGPPSFADALAECDADKNGKISRDESKSNRSVLSRPDADGEGDHPLAMFVRMLDANKDGEIEEAEWPKLQGWIDSFQHANGFVSLRLSDAGSAPELTWNADKGVPECPTSLIIEDKLFAIRNGGVVTLMNLKDGQSLFRDRIDLSGPIYASPVRADHKIYLASARGDLAILQDTPPFRMLSKRSLNEPIWATPALSNGGLIVRSEHHLWCFRK